MKGDLNKVNVNTASISGEKFQSIPKIYTAENALSGQKSVEPVSIAMQNFVKSEFSKVKSQGQ